MTLLAWTWPDIVFVGISLTHDFLETVSLNELDSVVLVNFIHRDALVLKCKEEVDELANFVGVVGLLLLQLLHFSFLVLEFY